MDCLSQIKPFASVTHQYVNNIFAITVQITFVIPYHGLIDQNKTVQLATRQPNKLWKILKKAKLQENSLPSPVQEVGFFPCNDGIYHKFGCLKLNKSFNLK